MIYVAGTDRIYEHPDGQTARISGNGHAVHVIDKDGEIIGNYPTRGLRFWGAKLSPQLERELEIQRKAVADQDAARRREVEGAGTKK
jgi:hypothetical protein